MKRNFERYCKDYKNIENYDKAAADDFKGWDCHHRLETWTSDGERRQIDITVAELKALGMYYNRPANELIFLRKSEHTALRKVSLETRNKLSDIGKNISEETRKKLSMANKGHPVSEETRNKISTANKGNTYAKGNKSTKGMCWFNNGKINKVCYECPPGFIPGRLRK